MSDILDFTDNELAVRFACCYELRQWHVMAFEWFADAFISHMVLNPGITIWNWKCGLWNWNLAVHSAQERNK